MTTATVFSTREVPWMKLGKLTSEPKTAAEAAQLGGLDFTVSLCKTAFWRDGKWVENLDRKTVVHDGTGQALSVVSQSYPTLQYAEAFDFMDTVKPTYVAAGALRGGRQGFMVVEMEMDAVLKDIDPHDMYAVLRTSHDCTRAVEISVMPLRHRCMNQLTLNSFSKGVPYRWSVPHTSTMHAKLAEAQKAIQNLSAYSARFDEIARKLIKMKVTQVQAKDILESVLPDRPKRTETIERITTAWHTSEAVGFDWTGWGLLNAVSDHYDWGRPGGSPQSRFIGALQGQTRNRLNQVTARLLSRA